MVRDSKRRCPAHVALGVLLEVTEDGGLGFCHAAVPSLLPTDYHGPLVVALDSNALIDLQQYGHLLLDDALPDVDETYAENLAGLADLLNLWLLRDLRFVVTPRSLTDAKRLTQKFLDRRIPAQQPRHARRQRCPESHPGNFPQRTARSARTRRAGPAIEPQ